MAFIAILLASLLSPVRLIITLVVVLLSKRKWIIPVAAATSAVAVETLLTAQQETRDWGEGIVVGLLASLIYASVIYWIRGRVIRKRERAGTSTVVGAKVQNAHAEAHTKRDQ